MNSCSNFDFETAMPPTFNLINQEIRFQPGYLLDCGMTTNPEFIRGDLVYSVMIQNSSGNIVELVSNDSDGIDNDLIDNDDRAGSGSLSHIISVPDRGTWMLRIEVQLECSRCCNRLFIPDRGFACSTNQRPNGDAIYANVTPMGDLTAVPSPIDVTFMPFTCVTCRDLC